MKVAIMRSYYSNIKRYKSRVRLDTVIAFSRGTRIKLNKTLL